MPRTFRAETPLCVEHLLPLEKFGVLLPNDWADLCRVLRYAAARAPGRPLTSTTELRSYGARSVLASLLRAILMHDAEHGLFTMPFYGFCFKARPTSLIMSHAFTSMAPCLAACVQSMIHLLSDGSCKDVQSILRGRKNRPMITWATWQMTWHSNGDGIERCTWTARRWM